MNNEQAIKELQELRDKLTAICDMHFAVYKQKDAKAMTDKICEKIAALDIAINAVQEIDLLSEVKE